MINIPEKYRPKALASEHFAKEAPDAATKVAWEEIAIEWYTLANRAAQETCQKSNELR